MVFSINLSRMKTIITGCLTIALACTACSNDDSAPQTTVPNPNPIEFTEASNSGGCIDFQFYHYADDLTYGLLLSGDTDQLALSTDWQEFEFSPDQDEVTLVLYEFSQPTDSFFCDDAIEAKEDPIQEWKVVTGNVRLRIARERNDVGVYTIDVVISNVTVNNTTIDRLERTGVEVGFQIG